MKGAFRMLITIVQLIGILIPLAGLFALVAGRHRSDSAFLLMLATIGCLIMNSGNLMVAISSDATNGMLGLKASAAGSAVFFFFFVLFLLDYLRITVPKPAVIAWGVLELLYVVLFWIDRTRAVIFHSFGFYNHPRLNIMAAQNDTSWLWYLRHGFLAVLLTVGMVYYAVMVFRTKVHSERYNRGRLTGAQLLTAAALVLMIWKRLPFDIVPLASSLALLSVVESMLTDGFFGITDIANQEIFAQMKDAYFITDSMYGFLDANPAALEIFPELKDYKVGKRLPEVLCQRFEMENERDDELEYNGHFYEVKVTELKKHDTVIGYAMILDDETFMHNFNDRLQEEVREKTRHIQIVQDSIVAGMAGVIESRDNSTGGHIKRTSDVVRIFAKKLSEHAAEFGIDDQFLAHVIKAAPMHDIGKIAVDDRVLRKPGRFTPAEYEQMKKHPAEGAVMLAQILHEVDDRAFYEIAVHVANYHHERWDGNGYPRRLAGENIPLEARIMALADVFDALVSKRCYKDAFAYDDAFSVIEKDTGTHFDPKLAPLFLECREELIALYEQYGWRNEPAQRREPEEPLPEPTY